MEKVIGVMNERNAEIPLLKQAIQSFQGQMEGVIIVDSSFNLPEFRKELRQIEAEFADFVTVVWDSEDRGGGESLSQGSHLAVERGATWVITLLDDTILRPGTVAMMLKAYHNLPPEEQKVVGLIAPNLTIMGGLAFPDGEPKIDDKGGTTEGQLIKAAIFPVVGYWNSALRFDHIDGEFCLRVHIHGLRTLRVPRAIVQARYGHPVIRHFFWKTISVPNYPPWRYYYMSRNLLYLYTWDFRNFILRNNQWYAVFWAIIIPRYFIKMVLFETNRKAKILACLHGWWDGIRGRLGPMPK